jgi:O-antigen/teichoic acid export membrane protein
MLAALTTKVSSLFGVYRYIMLQFAVLQGTQLLVAMINIIIFSYLGKMLDLKGFGVISLGYAVVGGLMVFVDMGLTTLGTRDVAQDEAKAGAILSVVSCLRLVFSLIIVALSSLVALFVFTDRNECIAVILSCIWLIPYAISSEWLFQGLSRMYFVAASRIIYQLSTLVIIVLLVNEPSDLFQAALARPIAQAIVTIFLTYAVVQSIKLPERLSLVGWQKFMRSGFSLAFAIFLSQIYSQRTDHIFLRMWYSNEVVALYSGAYTLHMAVVSAIQIAIFIFFPTLSSSYSKGWQEFERTRKRFLIEVSGLGVVLTFLVFIFGEFFLTWIFGYNYIVANTSLMILALDPMIIGISSIYAYSLIVAGFEKDLLLIYGSGAVINILLNVMAIPLIGIDGASLSTICAEMAVLLVGFICFRRRMLRQNTRMA